MPVGKSEFKPSHCNFSWNAENLKLHTVRVVAMLEM